MDQTVEIRGVTKRYHSVTAVEDVSFSAHPGELLGLIGHNGAGKSTLIKLMLGLITPDEGEVRVLGKSPSDRKADMMRAAIGYLPESVTLYDNLSGREVLHYLRRLKQVGGSESDNLLEEVGLAKVADRRVRTYSKGMRQRLGLAQALLGKPRLLLMDEPTSGLDPIATRDMFRILDERRSQGATVILSSHALAEVERRVDRAVILGHGRMLMCGTLEELRRAAGLPFRIHLRGKFDGGDWRTQLEQAGAQIRTINATTMELEGQAGGKLELLRELLAIPGLTDLQVAEPTLEALYVHADADIGGKDDYEHTPT